jgi:large subunit ribosomal protein L15
MKLHDLRPAPGAHTPKRRVGRGIAAGQGKTAGRGTKGQRSRAGGNLPAWFEGGQTPLHQRIPKLRGFRNPFKIEYEVVNIGAIARLVELGALESAEPPPRGGTKKRASKAEAAAPITVNQEILRAAGLVRTLDRPMKVLGGGDLGTPLFVVADAFSATARSKIETAGGTVSVLEVPTRPTKAIGVKPEAPAAPVPEAEAAPVDDATAAPVPEATAPAAFEADPEPDPEPAPPDTAPTAAPAAARAKAKPAKAKAPKAKAARSEPQPAEVDDGSGGAEAQADATAETQADAAADDGSAPEA